MNVFKSILVVAVFSLLSFPLMAQGPGERGPRGPQPERLQEALGLSEEQMESLKPIFEETRAQMQGLREKEFEDRADRRAAAQQIMGGQKAKMANILTEAQLAKLEEMRPERGPKASPGARPSRAQNKALHKALKDYQEEKVEPVLRKQRTKLESDLSAEDKATIAALRQKRGTHTKKMRQGRNKGEKVSPPSKGQGEQHQADRATIKALVEKYDAQIDALLAEVQSQAEQWEKDRKAIHEKYRPEDAPKSQRRNNAGQGKAMRKAHFLMMEPAN
ncbi:MAG TPA: hypothetical protein VJ953_15165 [Saprospiraceae bacterium]|nr:hypothetical protein [Saprospiraceae bacterium]